VARIPLEAALLHSAERPIYQQIGSKALQLRGLGFSDRLIAKRLRVTDKTVAKAVAWLRGVQS